MLVAPFEDGPRRVSVSVDGRRLVLDAVGVAVKYALVVVDEAHHLYTNPTWRDTIQSHVVEGRTKLWLLSEFCAGGAVRELLLHSGRLSEAEARLLSEF